MLEDKDITVKSQALTATKQGASGDDRSRRSPVHVHHATRTLSRPTSLLLVLALVFSGVLPAILSGCGEAGPQPTQTAQLPAATSTPNLPLHFQSTAADYWPTSGWRISTPEEQGMDSTQLLDMLQYVDEAGINLRSVTIIRNGYVVLDAYYQPYTADRKYPVFSVTKSVIGALTGIALNDGYLTDIRQPLLSFFPERTIANRDSNKEAITIEDLLTMQPGLDCADEKIGSVPQPGEGKEWVQYFLDLPMDSSPGQKLVYCTGGVHLLSSILTRATMTSTAAYAQSRLFTPLGISQDSILWPSDPEGITLGGYGIEMRPSDMAKLGLLYLYGGKWQDKQIVPEEWVAASTRVHSIGDNDKNYGYLFWVYPDHFAAEGLGEQKIQVVKDRNLVAVMTAAIDWQKGAPLEKLLQDYIVPAAQSDGPLPANPTALAKLQNKVKFLAEPLQPVPALPEIARQISGKSYVFETNSVGWKALTPIFEEGAAEARVILQTETGDSTVAIGLDNVYRQTQTEGNSQWLRGRWEGNSTFVARQLQLSPALEEMEFRLEFTGDQLNVHAQEMVFGNSTVDLKAHTK